MDTNHFTPKYEITPLTMAVLAHQDGNGSTISYVIEEQGEYYVDITTSDLIAEACMFFGATLKGRQIGTSKICGFTHKLPISIDPGSGMYFLPTASPSKPDCSWIGHSHIYKLNGHKNDLQTELIFNNGKSIILDVSYGSMLNQVTRTAHYRFLLENRIRKFFPRDLSPF